MQSPDEMLKQRLTNLQKLAEGVAEPELKAELTKYLCILASCYLEVSCKEILGQYTNKKCAPDIANFVKSHLSDLKNPNIERVAQLLGRFSSQKAEKWKTDLSDKEKDSVNSIVNNRNQIAHGGSVGLSYDIFTNYYHSALTAVAKLRKEFPPF